MLPSAAAAVEKAVPKPSAAATSKPKPEAVMTTKVPDYPEKTGPYKAPEYYAYNPMSFYDIENAMHKFRLKQPSSLK